MDGERRVIHVRLGKGGKNSFACSSPIPLGERIWNVAKRSATSQVLALSTNGEVLELQGPKAVEEAVFDMRWQLVLGCLGTEEPPFSQGVLVDFRRRLVAHDMDKKLPERTVRRAEETGQFGAKQLKVALDSAPLWGAGRVEGTFNLIGRRHVGRC